MNNIKFDTDTIIPGVCAYCGQAFDTCAGDGMEDEDIKRIVKIINHLNKIEGKA